LVLPLECRSVLGLVLQLGCRSEPE
jgi:hypothetical protein